MKQITVCTLVVFILCTLSIGLVNAGNSINSGYAVTSNYHGIDVPPGAEVIIIATTTDTTVDQVTFKWKDPDENLVWQVTVLIDKTTTPWEARSSSTGLPIMLASRLGDWGVQAFFQDLDDGKTKASVDYVVSTKATSFFVIPELPFGTLLGLVTCMAALVAIKTKRTHLK